jgi:hypothetical protein
MSLAEARRRYIQRQEEASPAGFYGYGSCCPSYLTFEASQPGRPDNAKGTPPTTLRIMREMPTLNAPDDTARHKWPDVRALATGQEPVSVVTPGRHAAHNAPTETAKPPAPCVLDAQAAGFPPVPRRHMEPVPADSGSETFASLGRWHLLAQSQQHPAFLGSSGVPDYGGVLAQA